MMEITAPVFWQVAAVPQSQKASQFAQEMGEDCLSSTVLTFFV
jgi:hypothetical protein